MKADLKVPNKSSLATLPALVKKGMQSPSRPLEQVSRGRMETRFGHDFSRVRIHTGAAAAESAQSLHAEAYTLGNDIVLGANQDSLTDQAGQKILAHELTHVVQQGGAKAEPYFGAVTLGAPTSDAECEAQTAASAVSLGRLVSPVKSGLGNRVVQRESKPNPPSPKTASLADKREFVQGAIEFLRSAAEFYRLLTKIDDGRLDQLLEKSRTTYSASRELIRSDLGNDLTLAEELRNAYKAAVEALLTTAAKELNRTTHDLFDSHRSHIDEAAWLKGQLETFFLAGGKPFEDSLGTTAQNRSVKVYYFPGQTDERALVIAGVHGSELSGIEVAELLVEKLKTAPTKPYYTVAVVPSLFPDNRALAESQPKKIGTAENIGRYTMTGGKQGKDPNRQLPALGKDLDITNPVDAKGAAIEPENIMLLKLIERFRPTRIASVHATRPEGGKDASGIYADPKTDENQIALGVDDDAKLAIRMAERAKKEGANVPGNKLDKTPTALYPLDKPFVAKGKKQPRKTDEGVSLGGWGTTAVAGGRTAMTVITVEVQTANPSLKPGDPEVKRSQQRLKELQAHSIAIQEIFLGPP